jgi:hypothetical protein
MGILIYQRYYFKKAIPLWIIILINLIVGYIFLISVFIIPNIGFAALFFLPGLIFPLALSIPLKENILNKSIFIIGSVIIYYLMTMLSMTNGYFGPNQKYLLLASVSGALLETLLFCFLFKCISFIRIWHIISLILLSLLACIVPNAITIEILPWQLLVGLISIFIYQRKLTLHKYEK